MSDLSGFRFEVRRGSDMTQDEQAAVLALCSEAYEEDFQPYLACFSDPIHVLARKGERLVSHALWITRWLQIGNEPLLRTAYIEAVATGLEFRNLGLASQVMRLAVETIAQDPAYEIAALCPSDARFYERLGWERWQGPLSARRDNGLVSMPEEEAMVYPLPTTPDYDRTLPISIEWRDLEPW